ncbi:chloride channel protein [Oceanicaulis sp. LC35]|uniref:chloride channel protein n=1 Tax=Oceanicaulis sp. LC35 TaxID=3349635 RepID=UPI003F875A74
MSTAVTPPPLSPLDKLLRYLKNSFADGRSPALWLLALVVGVVAGYAAIGLRLAIQSVQLIAFGEFSERLASTASTLPAIMVILAPVAGGCVVSLLLYVGLKTKWLPEIRAEGVADVMEARAAQGGKMALMPSVWSALVHAVSIGAGGSTGREGPSVNLGAALASFISQPLNLPARGARIMLACGASAAVAASFNAPVAGALFAFEVVLGHYALRSIGPVAAASVIGAILSRIHFGATPAFSVPEVPPASLADFIAIIPLGLVSAALAIACVMLAFNVPRHLATRAQALSIPLWILPPFGGLLIGGLGLLAPEVLGVGYEATSIALAGGYAIATLAALIVLKLAAIVATMAFRFGGGIFAPSLYLGAMLGALYGALIAPILGPDSAGSAYFAVIGMGAVGGAVLGAPLSTTLIVFELTASYEASIALLVCVSLASVITTSITKGSFFHKQVERHGFDLTQGDARVILQTIRARDIMTPLDSHDTRGELDEPCVYDDDYLGRVMGFFSAEKIDGAQVRSRHGDQPIVGYITKADAHAAYAHALQARHEEEHR